MGSIPTADDPLSEVTQRLPRNGISVIVVGSGIGGLSAARECWRIGCDVTVLEKRAEGLLSGDTFMIGPTALAALRKFPRLFNHVRSLGHHPDIYIHGHDGTRLQKPIPAEAMISETVRGVMPDDAIPQITFRPQLYAAMLEQLRRVGVPVEHAAEVVEYFEGEESAGVVLKDGCRREAHLVVAADGIRSVSSNLVLGKLVPARPSGQAVLRVVYPSALADGNEVVQNAYPTEKAPMTNLYFGGPKDLQLYVFRFKDSFTWGCVHEDDGRAQEAWDAQPPRSILQDHLDKHPDLPECVKEVIRMTPSDAILDFQIMLRDPQPTWTSPRGRVIQLGDAAHPFHPNSGNGATQAVEDAASLATCLLLSQGDIPAATRVSNLLRFERVSCIQAFGLYSEWSRRKGQRLPPFSRWIIAHDAEAYARENFVAALNHLRDGSPFKNTNIPPGTEYLPWTADTLIQKMVQGEPTILDGDWA